MGTEIIAHIEKKGVTLDENLSFKVHVNNFALRYQDQLAFYIDSNKSFLRQP